MTKENKEEFFSQMTDRYDIVNFVKEVEKYPCIYNHTLPSYSNRAVTTRAWTEIAKKLESNISECRDKWRKIRIAFIRSLKQAARGCPPMRPYYLSEHLSFVLPFMKVETHNQQSPTPEEDDEIEIVDTKQEVQSDEEDETNNYNTHTIFFKTHSDPISDAKEEKGERKRKSSDYIDKISDQISDTKGKRKCSDVFDKISDQISEAKGKKTTDNTDKVAQLNEGFAQKRKCSDNIEDNPRKMFLLSLMPDVESLTEQEMRVFRRCVISSIDDIMNAREN